MSSDLPPTPIPLPLAHVGSVNAWLLRGEPLTLIDTGPRDDAALSALEAGMHEHGLRIDDLDLVLLTHHHVDHVGLAAEIQRRSGATIAALDRLADYGTGYAGEVEQDRRFAHELMRFHGVPERVIAADEPFWAFLRDNAESFETGIRLAGGDTIAAGGRTLEVVARPGHSTTDTLFVDSREALAFTGDHLLSRISSNTEICPPERAADGRARSRIRYLDNLRETARMPLRRLMTGHGPVVTGHRRLVAARLDEHRRRCERILAVLERGPSSAYEIAGKLWVTRTVAEQPLLVVWEVLGHLELLLAADAVSEDTVGGRSVFAPTHRCRRARAAWRPRPALVTQG